MRNEPTLEFSTYKMLKSTDHRVVTLIFYLWESLNTSTLTVVYHNLVQVNKLA